MKQHFKKHWFEYLFLLFFVIGLILGMNNIEVNFSGVFGWLLFLVYGVIKVAIFYAAIFGGEVSYKTDGLIPFIKKLFKKKSA